MVACGNCGASDNLTRMDDPVMPTPEKYLCDACIKEVTRHVRKEADD